MSKTKFTPLQQAALILLRLVIGWHFLYEGLAKLFNPNWTSAPYLAEAQWLFRSFFESILARPTLLKIVDLLNIWGLVAIGSSLILGCLAPVAICFGMLLLCFYYIVNPSLPGFKSSLPIEGNYLIVNKNLVELFALVVLLLFPTSRTIGLDRFIFWKKIKSEQAHPTKENR